MSQEQISKWGVAHLCLFGCKSTISSFGEHFCDGQYCLASFLFAVLVLTVPPRAQPFVKWGVKGARAPPMHYGFGATASKYLRFHFAFQTVLGLLYLITMSHHNYVELL